MEAPATTLNRGARLRALRQQLAGDLFEQDGLNVIFQLARNVLAATFILSCGLNASQHPERIAGLATWTTRNAGYVVFGLGVVLLLLNLWDGLRRLRRLNYAPVLRALAAIGYVAISLRLVEAIAVFRGVV